MLAAMKYATMYRPQEGDIPMRMFGNGAPREADNQIGSAGMRVLDKLSKGAEAAPAAAARPLALPAPAPAGTSTLAIEDGAPDAEPRQKEEDQGRAEADSIADRIAKARSSMKDERAIIAAKTKARGLHTTVHYSHACTLMMRAVTTAHGRYVQKHKCGR